MTPLGIPLQPVFTVMIARFIYAPGVEKQSPCKGGTPLCSLDVAVI